MVVERAPLQRPTWLSVKLQPPRATRAKLAAYTAPPLPVHQERGCQANGPQSDPHRTSTRHGETWNRLKSKSCQARTWRKRTAADGIARKCQLCKVGVVKGHSADSAARLVCPVAPKAAPHQADVGRRILHHHTCHARRTVLGDDIDSVAWMLQRMSIADQASASSRFCRKTGSCGGSRT